MIKIKIVYNQKICVVLLTAYETYLCPEYNFLGFKASGRINNTATEAIQHAVIIYLYAAIVILSHFPCLQSLNTNLTKEQAESSCKRCLWDRICAYEAEMLPHWVYFAQVFHSKLLIRLMLVCCNWHIISFLWILIWILITMAIVEALKHLGQQ